MQREKCWTMRVLYQKNFESPTWSARVLLIKYHAPFLREFLDCDAFSLSSKKRNVVLRKMFSTQNCCILYQHEPKNFEIPMWCAWVPLQKFPVPFHVHFTISTCFCSVAQRKTLGHAGFLRKTVVYCANMLPKNFKCSTSYAWVPFDKWLVLFYVNSASLKQMILSRYRFSDREPKALSFTQF